MEIKIRQKALSWNKFYEQKHWSYRSKLAKEWQELVRWACYEQQIKKVGKGKHITIEAHCKGKMLDADNVNSKVIIDGLKYAGIIGDDTNEWVKSVTTKCIKDKTDFIKVVITKT